MRRATMATPSRTRGARVADPRTLARVCQRVAAIAESATLAVDAKAKALKAAGEPVIGFGAGEPDFPTPAHIVEAAVEACRDPRNHQYTPAGGLPELKEAIAAKTLRDSGLDVHAEPGARHQRRQARRLQHLRHAARPGRRGAPARAVLDHLPRADRARRRRAGRAAHRRDDRVPGHRRPARGGRHRPHQGAALRVAVEPDRRGVPGGRGRGDRPLGGRARHLGDHRRDLRAPHLRRAPSSARCPTLVPELREQLRRAQRRGQDLRHDRLAGRLDDRARRRDQGGHQPPVARHLERRQREPAGRAGRGVRRPHRRGRDAGRLRAARPHHAPAPHRHRRRHRPRAAGRLLRLPQPQPLPRPTDPRAARPRPRSSWQRAARRGQGRDRPRRGLRRARLRPPQLRPRRRRPRRGLPPHRRPAGRGRS